MAYRAHVEPQCSRESMLWRSRKRTGQDPGWRHQGRFAHNPEPRTKNAATKFANTPGMHKLRRESRLDGTAKAPECWEPAYSPPWYPSCGAQADRRLALRRAMRCQGPAHNTSDATPRLVSVLCWFGGCLTPIIPSRFLTAAASHCSTPRLHCSLHLISRTPPLARTLPVPRRGRSVTRERARRRFSRLNTRLGRTGQIASRGREITDRRLASRQGGYWGGVMRRGKRTT